MATPTESILREDLAERRERLAEALAVAESEHLRGLLDQVDAALARVDRGTYGICEECHEPIGEQTLAAYPLLQYCLEHLSPEEQRILQNDLELASRIQSKLLPERNLRHAGWEVYYHYEPAGPVGGDYCDLVPAESGDMFFFLGDAAGKGVSASMLTAQLHGLFRTLVALDLPIDRMLERANRIFCESVLVGHYATLVCGCASRSGQIELVNAGHPAPLVLRDGRAAPLEATGQPLGLFSDATYDTKKVELAPGETLLLYTDGFSETRNHASVEYGAARVARIAAERRHLAPEALVRACLDDVAAFEAGRRRADDLTLMALRRLA